MSFFGNQFTRWLNESDGCTRIYKGSFRVVPEEGDSCLDVTLDGDDPDDQCKCSITSTRQLAYLHVLQSTPPQQV